MSPIYTWVSFLPSFPYFFLLAFLPCQVELVIISPQDAVRTFPGFGNYSESHCWQASSWFGLVLCCRESCVSTVLSLPRNSHGIHTGAEQAAQLLCPQITECTVVCYTGWRLYNTSWCERDFWYSISTQFQCWPGDPQDKKWGTHPIP